MNDAKTVKEGVLGLGARINDIVLCPDITFDELAQLFKELLLDIGINWRKRERTLVFLYYAGHGGLKLKGSMHALLNDVTLKKLFPLEKFIRKIGSTEGAYVVALLDCCRSLFSTEMMRGIEDEEEKNDESGLYRNIFLTYGCPPEKGVDADSTIAFEYF